jgi:hypothetical protein
LITLTSMRHCVCLVIINTHSRTVPSLSDIAHHESVLC